MILETPRLILRPWRETDAKSLYRYAQDPRIGPIAGWPVHTSEENSLDIIRTVLAVEETYAVTLREEDSAIGSIGLMIGESSNLGLSPQEGEVGYWIAAPFWGRGYIPEAVGALIRHGFEDLSLTALWCGYFEGNDQSRRVGEKCGFTPVRVEEKYWPLIDQTKLQHITCLTKAAWQASTPD